MSKRDLKNSIGTAATAGPLKQHGCQYQQETSIAEGTSTAVWATAKAQALSKAGGRRDVTAVGITATAEAAAVQERARTSWDTDNNRVAKKGGNVMLRKVGTLSTAGTGTLVTAGIPETLEKLAAKGTPTAVGTAATAELLATARILGTFTATEQNRKSSRTDSSARENWKSRERQQQQDPGIGGKTSRKNIKNSMEGRP
jgi:hypothetical protein